MTSRKKPKEKRYRLFWTSITNRSWNEESILTRGTRGATWTIIENTLIELEQYCDNGTFGTSFDWRLEEVASA